MEGNIGEKSTAFFESPGFKTFNFALLERLSTIQHTTQGFSELDLTETKTQKKLKASLKKLDTVVMTLQQLLDISTSYKTAEIQTIHPEKIFHILHQKHSWPKLQTNTYQSLLVSIPDELLANLLQEIFTIEKASRSNLAVSFRRRESKVVVRLFTPKTDWVSSRLYGILKDKNACLPLQSDSLETIILRAIVCVLETYDVKLRITGRQPNSVYFSLPSARQLEVFARETIQE